MKPIRQVLIAVDPQSAPIKISVRHEGQKNIAPADLNELLKWTRSLRLPENGHPDLLNLFFFPLPGGDYALGRFISLHSAIQREKTVTSRRSYYIHFLIIAPDTLLAFGNNPISLYQDALAAGKLSLIHRQELDLSPFVLTGVRRWFDKNLVTGMSVNPGGRVIAALVQSALNAPHTLFTGGPPALHLISTLTSLFPIHFRPKLTFAIGIAFSPEMPVRLIGLLKKGSVITDFQKEYSGAFFDIDPLISASEKIEIDNTWGRLIDSVLTQRQLNFFQRKILEEYFTAANSLPEERSEFSQPSYLPQLGNRWLSELSQILKKSQAHISEKISGGKDNSIFNSSSQEIVFDELDSLRQLFRLKRQKTKVQKSFFISEKLKHWLFDANPEESILFFRDKKEESCAYSEDASYSPEVSESFPPKLPSPPSLPRLENNVPEIPKISHNEPLLIFAKGNRIFSPFQQLLAKWPNEETRLLELDAFIEQALTGDFSSTERLSQYWLQEKKSMNPDLEWDIREEYIHFVQAYLTYEKSEIKTSYKSLGALEVLDLFLNENIPLGSFSGLD